MNKADWQKQIDVMDNSSRVMPVLVCGSCPQLIRHGETCFCMAGDEQSGEIVHLFIDDEDAIHKDCPLPSSSEVAKQEIDELEQRIDDLKYADKYDE